MVPLVVLLVSYGCAPIPSPTPSASVAGYGDIANLVDNDFNTGFFFPCTTNQARIELLLPSAGVMCQTSVTIYEMASFKYNVLTTGDGGATWQNQCNGGLASGPDEVGTCLIDPTVTGTAVRWEFSLMGGCGPVAPYPGNVW
eukprot:Hpha_TRINITY_DN4077_c0_g2::TRINITY_DN4077_c0_g2_i1::g.63823::m.63823